jgi:integrase/recombinase XerD
MRLYRLYLGKLVEYLGDPEVSTITHTDLSRYMNYLRIEYVPNRPSGDDSPLSSSALDNHWKAIRSLFGWCHEVLNLERPDLHLPQPKYKLPEIIPFTEDEMKRILQACEYTRKSKTHGRRSFRMKRPTAHRDKAIVLLLIDTGLRLSEICRLRIKDVDIEKGEVYVKPYGSGQKTKSRTVYIGKSTRRAIWRYLARREIAQPENPLFELAANSIRSLLKRLGERAQVSKVHPHRFRHTFAIQFLRNGGNVFSLQRLLGHSSLEMVKHYLKLANSDDGNAHLKASPADRWRL